MMRLYMFKDDTGMALIAARSPAQARQMATWEWGDTPMVHLGDATREDQPVPELIAEAIVDKSSDKRWRGKRLMDRWWEELDVTYARIIKLQRKGKNPAEILSAQNYARGIAFCLAHVQNPYNPNVDSIREMAADRYEAKHG